MVNKWEIYFADLDPAIGSEQKGIRPVIIISNDMVNHHIPVSTVLPLSSFRPEAKRYPTEVPLDTGVTGLPRLSVVMIQQVRTISHERLFSFSGMITDISTREKILDTIREYFEM